MFKSKYFIEQNGIVINLRHTMRIQKLGNKLLFEMINNKKTGFIYDTESETIVAYNKILKLIESIKI